MVMKTEDKGKIRLLVVELEGNNKTLQDVLTTVNNMTGRGALPLRREVPALPPGKKGKAQTNGKPKEVQEDEEETENQLFVEPGAPLAEDESEEEQQQTTKKPKV